MTPIQLEDASIKKKTARVVVVMFVLFLVWAVWAPLDAGVILPGTVVVLGNRKAVQHPAGGVVKEILVREGDKVKKGDPLVILNSLTIDSELNTNELEYINAMATLSRLMSERTSRAQIAWTPKMKPYEGDQRLDEAKRLQGEIFKSRTTELKGQQSILHEQLSGLEAQLKGLNEVMVERRFQIKTVTEEARNAAELAAAGFVPKVQASQAERLRSDMVAGIATLMAEQSRAQAAIAGARLQLIQLLSAYHKDIDTQTSEFQRQYQALESRVEALKFNRSLISIRAPVDGAVVGLKANTLGGVIGAGAVLMEIVPVGGRLVVDAQVPPHYIDKILAGMPVDLRFSAFSMITTPVIPGKVTLIGADKQTSTSTSTTALAGQGTDFYLAQIETDEAGVKLLGGKVIQPGMPVEVVFKTGERNFVSLLVKPISDRLSRAFKE
ncbi:MAG: HlyD family type I secretion periplasmic adaptor subunit [Pseudomonadota bacterium]